MHFRREIALTTFIIALFLQSITGATQYTLPLSEDEILEKLYRFTNGPQWTTSTNWLKVNSHYCSWYGITCSEIWGGITKIQLPSNNLVGDIPEEVFWLPRLNTVNFNGNKRLTMSGVGLNTTVSASKSPQSPVKILKMENTGIGTTRGFVFDLISNLSRTLTTLYLSGVDFGGAEIPQQITELPKLQYLYISGCNFSGNLPTAIGDLKSLQVLDASKNFINGYIPTTIGALGNLTELELSENLFTGTLPSQQLGRLEKLERLSIKGLVSGLSNTTLNGGLATQMQLERSTINGQNPAITGPLPDFAMLSRLRELYLSNNRLTGSIPRSFLGGISDRNATIQIHLESNDLTGVVPETLSRFGALELYIANNKFRSIHQSLCSKKQWMNGAVGRYGCEAIVCPRNTYSSLGRQSNGQATCRDCDSDTMAPYVGSTSCMTFANAAQRLQWEERLILLDFYDGTGGENWTTNTFWGQDTKSICTWYGVSCANSFGTKNGIVQSIVLPNNNLKGTPPSEIFQLKALEALNLSKNDIDMVLSDIGDNSGAYPLKHLRLDNTAVSSLEGISRAENLQTLTVVQTKLSGTLPEEIYSLSKLQELRLDHNKFTGTLSAKIGRLTNLQYLSVAQNNLSGSIPAAIGNLKGLEVLNLAENGWNGTLPPEIQALARLETLDISDWNDEGNGLKGHLLDFANNKKLKQLLLGGNSLTGTIPETFLSGISNVYDEIEVDLRWNIFTGVIPEKLALLENVDFLVTGNFLTGTIPQELCTKKNWMSGEVAQYGCDAILCPAGTYNAIGRQMQANQPCKPCPESHVASHLGTMGGCEYVTEATKQKEREREILVTLYNWMGGEKWTRQDNWLNETVDICKWYGVSCIDKADNDDDSAFIGWVEKLILPKNSLSGKSPSAMFELPALSTIDISNNKNVRFQFNGINQTTNLVDLNLAATDTKDLTGLSKANLTSLSLSNNKLSSYYFPEEILQLKSLRRLYLSECGLGGTLPNAIGNLVELEVLDVYGNEFTGQIPSTLSNLRKMINLTLSDNAFVGALPEGFGFLSNLENLHLENNAASENGGLVGPLPDFSGLVSIRNLYLGSNSFSGTIPSSFLGGGINVHQPIKIDLRWNQLRGTVPVTLDKFDALEIYLSGNYLEGIDTALCSNNLWMKGGVAKYGCDAILCPTGTYSTLGRQAMDSIPCTPCATSTVAPYMGSVACVKSDDYQAKERAALTEFYNATGGSNWRRQDNWFKGLDVCTWFGVRCERGQVVELNLAGNNLDGSFPSIILDLPYLEDLNLGENDMVFSFEHIGAAKRLKQLNLNATRTTSLEGIGQAKNLTVLHLEGNNFAQTLPSELYQLHALRELYISSGNFSGTLSDDIRNLVELEVFNGSGNYIHGKIPYSIGSLKRLRMLDLANNKLSGTIPSSLLQLTNIEELSLADQRSKGGVGFIGQLLSFETCTALTELYLGRNSLTGTIPSNILNASDPSAVITIDLSSNQLSGDVPDELLRFDYLNIQLTDNKFERIPSNFCSKSNWMYGKVGEYGCDAILCPAKTYNAAGRQERNDSKCEPCSGNHTSPYLGVLKCRAVDVDERSVLENLYQTCGGATWSNNTNWLKDDVDICDWYGIECDENGLVASINLGANHLHGSIPTDVFSLTSLTKISLYSNPISFSFDGIGNATNLETLELDFTGLQSLNGIGQANNLKEVHCRFNKLWGSIPDEISKLRDLIILDLSDNKFSGKLPTFLGDFLQLESLQLGSNSLSGSLPDFSSVTTLTTLDLSGNKITGTIPPTFLYSVDSSDNIFVDLSSNRITGTVPKNLTRLANLSIHLKGNLIEGIDSDLCQQKKWFGNEVGLYGCDGILCPKGTFNDIGRQSTDDNPCVECKENQYYGSTSCSGSKAAPSLRDVSASATSQRIRIGGTIGLLAGLLLFAL